MRAPLAALVALALVLPATAVLAQPGSGTRWEVTMKMPGMEDMPDMQMPEGVELPEGMELPAFGGGGMTQKLCMPKDEREPPPAEQDCKILEHTSTGNRHVVKMQCPDGLMVMDQTRTATTMKTHMTMTDRAGEVTEMDMTGRAIGDCDYTAEVDAQRRQAAALQADIEKSQKKAQAEMAKACDDALDRMYGAMFAGKDSLCGARQKDFCARLATRDGYSKWAASEENNPAYQQAGHDRAAQLKTCGLTEKGLLGTLCADGARSNDFRFVGNHCPAERPRLCRAALEREELWYISRHCEAERQDLVATHCAGRKYSSDISEKYRDFCVGALGADLGGGGDDAGAAGKPADPVQQGVKKGVDGLKKVFGL